LVFDSFLARGNSKTQQNSFCKTKRVEQLWQKNGRKKQKPFVSVFFLIKFLAFLGEKSFKPPYKNIGTNI
jgi:hypothetical protein